MKSCFSRAIVLAVVCVAIVANTALVRAEIKAHGLFTGAARFAGSAANSRPDNQANRRLST